jgi:Ca2+-binding EF-hand superfamily protein
MKKTLPVLVTLVALGLGATNVQARGADRPAMPTFEQLDTDSSGSVTLQDFQAFFASRVTTRQDEAIAKLMERAGEDGKLDEAGLRAGLEALRSEQRDAMGEQMRDGRKGRGDDHGRKGREDRADRGSERGQMGERMFSRIDTNSDGSVDAAEYEAFTTRMAERMEGRGEGRGFWRN